MFELTKVDFEASTHLADTIQGVRCLFVKSERVTLAACMAHVRRKFDEAFKDDQQRTRYALAQIAKLYALEQKIRKSTGLNE